MHSNYKIRVYKKDLEDMNSLDACLEINYLF